MALFWYAFMQLCGLTISFSLMRGRRLFVRIWLGTVFGSLLSTWLPVLLAFGMGFSQSAHLASAVTALAAAVLALQLGKSGDRIEIHDESDHSMRPFFIMLPAFMLLVVVILLNHSIPEEDGVIYTGQCTYGDMSMHLGFITSLARQQTFPPHYSILPEAKLCYPFLCDSNSASLYLLGMSLRWAYITPMLLAFVQVFCGAWFLAEEVCRQKHAPMLAFILFFLCGGFGTVFFFGKYSFSELFSGFYVTPTNLTDEGVRWVNVIADMLVPQRATLFGWSVLFACLYLLFRAVFRNDERAWLPAGIMGGLLPMIHTHSYLALGLTALCWLVYSLMRDGLKLRWFGRWCLFGVPAVLLAVPQLLEWTLQSVGGNASFLRFGFDWVNGGSENIVLFWLKNIGPMLIIIPFALIFADAGQRAACSGAILIFLLGEFILFQPNPYDNNKLFYVGYLFLCMAGADFLVRILGKISHRVIRTTAAVLLVVLCTNAAVLTLAREVVSGMPGYRYTLFSKDSVEAAEFIDRYTEPDSVFLTATNHNNTVAVLSGRNIVCGSASYLYYHGLDYGNAMNRVETMLSSAEAMEAGLREGGIDYVYMGPAERVKGNAEDYLAQNCAVVFSSATVTIYRVN